ncbi:isochorismate synthase [Cystobacter fuscus]
MSSPRPDFEARVERAVEAIRAGNLLKVVLARAVEVEAEHDFDRVDTLARLREQNPRCATFLFQAPDGTAFLGATPETLCRLEGRQLETEALAGSAAPARSGELESSDKDQREHQAVVRYILETLQPLAERVESDREPALLPLKNVVHLRTGIRATLREGVGVAELVSALQPTPAVGGTPRALALEFIAAHESLDRGWYAGPVGWVGPGRAHQWSRCARLG